MSEIKREAESPARAPRPMKKPKFSASGKGIKETDVGITTYLSKDLGGFTGALKQRYTDFLVNEIGLDGDVLHLSDDGILDAKERRLLLRKQEREEKERLEKETKAAEKDAEPVEDTKAGTEVIPELKSTGTSAAATEVTPAPEVIENKAEAEESKPGSTSQPTEIALPFEISQNHKIKIIEAFSEEDYKNIENLLRTPPKTKAEYHSTKPFNDRKERGALHQLIREAFQSKIETKTTPKNTFQFILVLGKGPSRPQKFQGEVIDTKDENGVENWGLGPVKEFLHFNLYKENKDTMEATNVIGRLLRVQPRFIRFAGTKDRRACTVQRLCLTRFKVERVNALNKTLRGMKLGCFAYEDKSLSLGDLKGNEFIITLRDVQGLSDDKPIEETVETALSSLRDTGFINYYGMQRFGTFSISTHTIGKEIMKSNWKKVVSLILSVQELVLPDSIKGRQIWEETKDAKKALDNMPKKCVAEWAILNHFTTCKKGEDGDYSENDYFHAIMKIPRNLRIMYGHAYQSYIWNCVASRRVEMFGMSVVAGDLVIDDEASSESTPVVDQESDDFEEDVRTDKYKRARAVTQEEVDCGKFTIYDVVLPLPGFDVNYPSNEELFNIYKDEMAKDGMDPLDMTRKTKDFSFAGSYRVVVAKPKKLEYFIRHYRSPTQQLVYTDLELLEKKKHGHPDIAQIIKDKGGDRVAVIIKLQLDSSAYATMALREVMKADTSRHGEMCDVKIQEEATEEGVKTDAENVQE